MVRKGGKLGGETLRKLDGPASGEEVNTGDDRRHGGMAVLSMCMGGFKMCATASVEL